MILTNNRCCFAVPLFLFPTYELFDELIHNFCVVENLIFLDLVYWSWLSCLITDGVCKLRLSRFDFDVRICIFIECGMNDAHAYDRVEACPLIIGCCETDDICIADIKDSAKHCDRGKSRYSSWIGDKCQIKTLCYVTNFLPLLAGIWHLQ